MRMPSRLRPVAGRFCAARSGVSAIEFAMVAPIFLAIVFFLIDTSISYMLGTNIDTATWRSAEDLRNGAVQTAGWTGAQFKTQNLCPHLQFPIDCSRVKVNLVASGSLNAWSVAPGTDYASVNESWCPGPPGTILVLQVTAPLPTLSGIWAGSLSKTTFYFTAGTFFQTDNYRATYVGPTC